MKIENMIVAINTSNRSKKSGIINPTKATASPIKNNMAEIVNNTKIPPFP